MLLINLISNLKNPADYEEFKAACNEKGYIPIPMISYSHKMGMLLMGRYKYPDIPPYEAFLKIQQEANESMGQPVVQQQSQPGQTLKAGCGKCGGGKTR